MDVCKLKDLATVHYGKSPKAIKTEFSNIPIYGTSGHVGFASAELFKGPLIVVARKGTLNNPIYTAENCWIIDTAYAVLAKAGIDTKWLYYNFLNYNLASLNEATGVPSINRDNLYNIKVFTPPLPEQQKIASILSTVDKKIESIEEKIKQTEQLKKGLMNKLLTEGIGHTEFKDSKIGRIPKSWEVSTINSLSDKVGSGITPKGGSKVYVEFGVPFIRSQNVLHGNLSLNNLVYISENQHQKMKNTHLQLGDVLLNITGASIGRCCVVPDKIKVGNVNQHVCIIRTNHKINSFYFSHILNSNIGQRQIMNFQAGGNREGLNFQQIKSFRIPLPPKPEQERINSILGVVFDKLKSLYSKKSNYETLKKGLMTQLLTGQIRVKI